MDTKANLITSKTNKINQLIDWLYEFHFKSHKGQFFVYIIAFGLTISYMILNGIFLARPQEIIVFEGLFLAIGVVIGLPLVYAFRAISREKTTAKAKETITVQEERTAKAPEKVSDSPKHISISDFYLKIEGIEGESEAVGFEKQIKVESWSMGASNAVSSGHGTGKVSMQDFHFVMQNSKASAQIMLAVSKGNHIRKAVLSCRKTGVDGTPYTYYKYTFNDLIFSSLQFGVTGMVDLEQASFNYTKIKLEYFQQKADGTAELVNTISYDVKKVESTGA